MTNPAYEATNSDVSLSELSGVALDWVVAQIIKLPVEYEADNGCLWFERSSEWNIWTPSTDWSQCGSLITERQIMLCPESHMGHEGTEDSQRWYADVYYDGGEQFTTAMCDTPLIAACSAIVGMEFGDLKSIAIPSQLLEASNG